MTTQTKSRGFTIVELLIVIVVIAILAAITIVAYNGITKNANSSAAKSNADSVRQYANTFQADQDNTSGAYPARVSGTALTASASGVVKLPSGLAFVTSVPTSSSAKTDVSYIAKTESSVITGACIGVWDPAASSGAGAPYWLYVGSAAGTAPTGGTPTCA